jgi:DNA-binding MarR family transcriptional regulator
MIWNLDDQLCFLMYSNFRKISRIYQDYLEPFQLTYTQYITLIVLFEKDNRTISEIGDRLGLDSGTLTPLIKKLEKRGILKRIRGKDDERRVYIELTELGVKLKEDLMHIPLEMVKHYNLTLEEAKKLYELLDKTVQ